MPSLSKLQPVKTGILSGESVMESANEGSVVEDGTAFKNYLIRFDRSFAPRNLTLRPLLRISGKQ